MIDRGASFHDGINWNDPPDYIQAEIESRIESVRLARLQKAIERGVLDTKRIIALRACGWNDRDIAREMDMTPAIIKQLLTTYGTKERQTASEGLPSETD